MERLEIYDLPPHTTIELDLGDFHQALNRETVIECLSKMLYFDSEYEDGDGLRIDEQVWNYINFRYDYEDLGGTPRMVIGKLIQGECGLYLYTSCDSDNNLYTIY